MSYRVSLSKIFQGMKQLTSVAGSSVSALSARSAPPLVGCRCGSERLTLVPEAYFYPESGDASEQAALRAYQLWRCGSCGGYEVRASKSLLSRPRTLRWCCLKEKSFELVLLRAPSYLRGGKAVVLRRCTGCETEERCFCELPQLPYRNQAFELDLSNRRSGEDHDRQANG